MKTVKPKNANIVLAEGQDEYFNLSAHYGLQKVPRADGLGILEVPVFTTNWKPTKKELKQLKKGGLVVVHIIGEHMPPIALETTDKQGSIKAREECQVETPEKE